MRGPRIVYIMSAGHSGSTLLDLLIGRHSEVTSVGELKALTTRPRNGCVCGARRFEVCEFWRAVELRLRESAGLSLAELDLVSADRARFARENPPLYAAIAAVAGRSLIVDSSKSLPRLAHMLALPQHFDVRPIHLERDPRGVVHSQLRKGRSLVYQTLSHRRTRSAVRALLATRPHLRVQYEELASAPEAVLRALMKELGLEYEPEQLDWAGGADRHSVGGNHMRHGQKSVIHLDDSWRESLRPWQAALIRTFG